MDNLIELPLLLRLLGDISKLWIVICRYNNIFGQIILPSSDDKKAVRLINYLKRLRILDNYIDGLSNQNDIKDKVFIFFWVFFEKESKYFWKRFFKGKNFSIFINLMYRYRKLLWRE